MFQQSFIFSGKVPLEEYCDNEVVLSIAFRTMHAYGWADDEGNRLQELWCDMQTGVHEHTAYGITRIGLREDVSLHDPEMFKDF